MKSLRFTTEELSILTIVTQAKICSDALQKSPLEGASDPLPEARRMLRRVSTEARSIGRYIAGDSVGKKLTNEAKEFAAKLGGLRSSHAQP